MTHMNPAAEKESHLRKPAKTDGSSCAAVIAERAQQLAEAKAAYGVDDHMATYPEVSEFAGMMAEELLRNAHKGGREHWRGAPPRQLAGEVFWHAAKLAVAMKEGQLDRIAEYAADTANACMMIVDAHGLLCVPIRA